MPTDGSKLRCIVKAASRFRDHEAQRTIQDAVRRQHNEGRDHNVQKQPGHRDGFNSGVSASSSHSLLSHHRFRSRMALPCLTPAAISPDSARTRSTAVSRDRFGNPKTRMAKEYKYVNESLLIASACVRDDDMESVDDQIQASWPGSNSVSCDRNAGSCRGRNHDQTLVGTGRSPPTAHRRYSPIRISAAS